MSHLSDQDPELFKILEREINREESTLELIASENFTSQAVMEMAGSVMTNKYAEGYPGKRYYGGCDLLMKLKTLPGIDWVNYLGQSIQMFNLIQVRKLTWQL